MTVIITLTVLVLIGMVIGRYLYVTGMNRQLERFRAMIEHNNDLISVIAPDGSLTYLSPSAVNFLGHPPEQLLGTHLLSFVHPDDLEMLTALWAEVLSAPGKILHTPEFRLVLPDGSVLYAETTGRNMTHDPAVGGILANTHDVTERRLALDRLRATQEQFLRSQKMEAVGRLAGGIAHDFNNLLTAIQGYTRLLLDDARVEGSIRADLEQVQQEAERAASLTRQLLAFSRRQLVQPRVLAVNDVIIGMRDIIAGLAGSATCAELKLDPATGHVRADAGQVEQVVLNLLVNALDAMPHGGRVTIATCNRAITADDVQKFAYDVRPGEYVEVSVTDTGSGIPAHVLPNIFEPFFTTKEAGRGTGMGLSTVYGVVKQSGGYVWVDTEEGVGTTLRVCLPRVAPADATPEAGPRRASNGGETILVIEDEDAVRKLTTRILERAGFDVLAAADGRAAVDLCAGHVGTIDLIVTDVVMPGMNGPEAVAQLRRLRSGLRVLFASGYTRDAIVEQGFVEAGIDFIEKPFSPDALVRKVRQVLDAEVRA